MYNRGSLTEAFKKMQLSDSGVNLQSVAVKKNGNIIVGDTENDVLYELSPTNGSLLHTIPVQTQPEYLAVLSNDWIAISGWTQERVDVVDVADGQAATVFTIKTTIQGQPAYCRGVCSDRSGIYIAIDAGPYNTGHIHHYDWEGNFMTCVAEGLYSPWGMTFTADGQQLAVADRHSVKMYHKVSCHPA